MKLQNQTTKKTNNIGKKQMLGMDVHLMSHLYKIHLSEVVYHLLMFVRV